MEESTQRMDYERLSQLSMRYIDLTNCTKSEFLCYIFNSLNYYPCLRRDLFDIQT